MPTELYYEESTFFRKKTDIAGTWEIQLGIESGKNNPTVVIIVLMENDKCVFDWLPVSPAVCALGSGRYLDIYTNFEYSRKLFLEG